MDQKEQKKPLSVASLSAKLTKNIPSAESEIARINKESYLSIAKKSPHDLLSLKKPLGVGGEKTESTSSLASSITIQHSTNKKQQVFHTTASSSNGSGQNESLIAEEWVNAMLQSSGLMLIPSRHLRSHDLQQEEEEDDTTSPLSRAGIDRSSLIRMGMSKELIDRLYRAFYVYTSGFHHLLEEIASHYAIGQNKDLEMNVWLVFLFLLEASGTKKNTSVQRDTKYEQAMVHFHQVTQKWKTEICQVMHDQKEEFTNEMSNLQNQLEKELTQNTLKSTQILDLQHQLRDQILSVQLQQHQIVHLEETIRTLEMDMLLLQQEKNEFNDVIDLTKKECELANSQRLSSLSQQLCLQEETTSLQENINQHEKERLNLQNQLLNLQHLVNKYKNDLTHVTKQNALFLLEKKKWDKEKTSLLTQLNVQENDIQLAKQQVFDALSIKEEMERNIQHGDAKLQSLQNQLTYELTIQSQFKQDMNVVTNERDELNTQLNILQAKIVLLENAKQHATIRPQDQVRIDRLLTQKQDLERQLTQYEMEKKKDQEYIAMLKATLEANENELTNTKKVFTASQQAFQFADRQNDQLRTSMEETEKQLDKMTRNMESWKGKFTQLDQSTKTTIQQLTEKLTETQHHLEQEMNLRVHFDKECHLLTEKFNNLQRDQKSLHLRVETNDTLYTQCKLERDQLVKDKRQKEAMISILQKLLIRIDSTLSEMLQEEGGEETLQEIVLCIQHTLREMGNLDSNILLYLYRQEKIIQERQEQAKRKLLEQKQKNQQQEVVEELEISTSNSRTTSPVVEQKPSPVSISIVFKSKSESESESEPVVTMKESECPSHLMDNEGNDQREATDASSPSPEGREEAEGGTGDNTKEEEEEDGLSELELEKLANAVLVVQRVGRNRRRVDGAIQKLERDVNLKNEMITSLQATLLTQDNELATLRTDCLTQKDQLIVLTQRFGMSIEETQSLSRLNLVEKKQEIVVLKKQVDALNQLIANQRQENQILTNQMQRLRQQFDRYGMQEEARRSQVAKEYAAYGLLVSLRQQKAIQATVYMKDANSQTLVPQRNPVSERRRIHSIGGIGNGIRNIEIPSTASVNTRTLMLFPDTILEHAHYGHTDKIAVQDLNYTTLGGPRQQQQLKLSKERRTSPLLTKSGTATPPPSQLPLDQTTHPSSTSTTATSIASPRGRIYSFQAATGSGLPVLDGTTSSESGRKPLSGLLGVESSVEQLERQQQQAKKNSFMMPRKPSHSMPWNPSSDYSTAHRQKTSSLQNISALHSEEKQSPIKKQKEKKKKSKKDNRISSVRKDSAGRPLDDEDAESIESQELYHSEEEEGSGNEETWSSSSDGDSEGEEETDELRDEEEEVIQRQGTATSSKSGTLPSAQNYGVLEAAVRSRQADQQKCGPPPLMSRATSDLSAHYRAYKKLDQPRDPNQTKSLDNPPSR